MGVKIPPPENHKVTIEISVDAPLPLEKSWTPPPPPPPPLENVGPQLEPRSELEPSIIIVFLKKKLSITENKLRTKVK